MDVKTFTDLQNEKAGYETLLRDARAKMNEAMKKNDVPANLKWTQVVSRLTDQISRVNRLLKD